MSEFDRFFIEEPKPIELEPNAVVRFLELVKERLPLPPSMVTTDVHEMRFSYNVDEGQIVTIAAVHGYRESDQELMQFRRYEVVVEEYYTWEDQVDVPSYCRERVIAIDTDSLEANLEFDLQTIFNEGGEQIDIIDNIDDDTANWPINTRQLAEIAMILEKRPPFWSEIKEAG